MTKAIIGARRLPHLPILSQFYHDLQCMISYRHPYLYPLPDSECASSRRPCSMANVPAQPRWRRVSHVTEAKVRVVVETGPYSHLVSLFTRRNRYLRSSSSPPSSLVPYFFFGEKGAISSIQAFFALTGIPTWSPSETREPSNSKFSDVQQSFVSTTPSRNASNDRGEILIMIPSAVAACLRRIKFSWRKYKFCEVASYRTYLYLFWIPYLQASPSPPDDRHTKKWRAPDNQITAVLPGEWGSRRNATASIPWLALGSFDTQHVW